MADENTQQELPISDNKGKDVAKLEAELEAARKEAAELRDNEKKAKAKLAAEKKAQDDKKAVEDGDAKRVLEQREAELAAERAQREALETLSRGRLEKMVAGFGEASKKQYELLKDSLPLPKLVEFVEAEASKASAQASVDDSDGFAPPAATPGQKGTPAGKFKLQPKAYEILDTLMKDPSYVESMKREIDPTTGAYKFVMPIKQMVERLRSVSIRPTKLSKEEYQRRAKW